MGGFALKWSRTNGLDTMRLDTMRLLYGLDEDEEPDY